VACAWVQLRNVWRCFLMRLLHNLGHYASL
jgi:hypothetical protein